MRSLPAARRIPGSQARKRCGGSHGPTEACGSALFFDSIDEMESLIVTCNDSTFLHFWGVLWTTISQPKAHQSLHRRPKPHHRRRRRRPRTPHHRPSQPLRRSQSRRLRPSPHRNPLHQNLHRSQPHQNLRRNPLHQSLHRNRPHLNLRRNPNLRLRLNPSRNRPRWSASRHRHRYALARQLARPSAASTACTA